MWIVKHNMNNCAADKTAWEQADNELFYCFDDCYTTEGWGQEEKGLKRQGEEWREKELPPKKRHLPSPSQEPGTNVPSFGANTWGSVANLEREAAEYEGLHHSEGEARGEWDELRLEFYCNGGDF